MPRAGSMNRLFTIQSAAETQDTYGEPDPTWAGTTTFWGELRGMQGKQAFDAMIDRTEQWFEVVTRYRTDLTAKMRLTADSVTYLIEAVKDPTGLRAETVLTVVVRG